MQVIFIHHSCFLVEVDEKVLIFDWFDGDRVEGWHFGGTLPEYEPDTPIYVFASHKHRDHFDMDVLRWAERYTNIHYIFSKDCRMSPHFLEKHGFPAGISKKILYVSACVKYEVDDLHIETLRSTDAGVAFYVGTKGVYIYHGGDLNDWKWEGAGDLVNGMMTSNYRGQIKRLANKKIHVAFVPADPSLGGRSVSPGSSMRTRVFRSGRNKKRALDGNKTVALYLISYGRFRPGCISCAGEA